MLAFPRMRRFSELPICLQTPLCLPSQPFPSMKPLLTGLHHPLVWVISPLFALVTSQRGSAAIDVDSYAPLLDISATTTSQCKSRLDHLTLARRWRIGAETAKRTLLCTTQLAIQDLANRSMTRCLKPTAYQLKHRRLKCTMFADILVGKCPSLSNNKYCTVFATDFQWTMVDPIPTKGECHYSLDKLHWDVGIPMTMIPDNAKELTEGEFKRKCNRAATQIKSIEPHTPNQNPCAFVKEVLGNYCKSIARICGTPTHPSAFGICVWCIVLMSDDLVPWMFRVYVVLCLTHWWLVTPRLSLTLQSLAGMIGFGILDLRMSRSNDSNLGDIVDLVMMSDLLCVLSCPQWEGPATIENLCVPVEWWRSAKWSCQRKEGLVYP